MMKLQALFTTLYQKKNRTGAILTLTAENGNTSQGEIAPLPGFSQESLQEALLELKQCQENLLSIPWSLSNYATFLTPLLPSVSFGLESALLELLDPLPPFSMPLSALLMGSYDQILEQADLAEKEGFTSAKVKIATLSKQEARQILHRLKKRFSLRVDVNSAFETQDALSFFAEFPLDTFDYIEDPVNNPQDFALFSHPLAVDAPFPQKLSLSDLAKIPSLKALVYKPTIQGGLCSLQAIYDWTQKQGIALVLSSSFETPLGLTHIAKIGKRLNLSSPLGLGMRKILLPRNSQMS